MPFLFFCRRALFATALLLAMATAGADEPCRVAFDLGSSGIRAGTSDSPRTVGADIDTLGAVWAGKPPEALVEPTAAVLDDLLSLGTFDRRCARVGGGFSAWRLALAQAPDALAAALAQIHHRSGVAVLVMPPEREGAYGHFAARQMLGERLATSHVLDIGGGSLQVAGERQSFVAALGQKSWHRLLCNWLRGTTETPCALQPMDERDLTRARALLATRLADSALPAQTTMTAISRPVSRGVQPAVQRLAGQAPTPGTNLHQADLQAAIAQLAPLDLASTATRTQAAASHAAYLLSDMILVDGLLRLTSDGELRVAEAAFTNLPGLLADERAFAWHDRYACYLQRLPTLGITAYASDPSTCPPPNED